MRDDVINEMVWSDLCADYPAEALQEALEERLSERMNTQEMEMRVIINEIFTRLAERDTLKKKYEAQFQEVEALRRRLRQSNRQDNPA